VTGTNRDLTSMQRVLDCRIIELAQLTCTAQDQAWIRGRLTSLGRQPVVVSPTLVNRRSEATKNVVDFSAGLPEMARCLAASNAVPPDLDLDQCPSSHRIYWFPPIGANPAGDEDQVHC
jgi:hypothetical protein